MNITRPKPAGWSMLSLLLAFGCAACCAQKESLTIGPGDLVHVKVMEAPELEETARVTDAGNIPLGLGGPVQVAGAAPGAAALMIARALSAGGFILTPHVLVTLEGTVTANVTLMGQVRAPGSYAINTPRPILDVLASAGGLTDVANRTVTVQRHGTSERLVLEVSNSSAAALDGNLVIFPGDTIIVPKADIVYVLGDVNRPGGIAIVTNDSRLSVVQALTLAGGTPPSAAPSHARLIRKQSDGSHVDIPLQLSAMQKGKHPDMQLQADDIVYVPFSYMRNMASGAGASVVGSASSAAIYKF